MKKTDNIDFENMESPEDLELKNSFKVFSKIIAYLWGFSILLLVFVPLFDFTGNQFIVTTAYLIVFVGLIYFIVLEFNFDLLFKIYKTFNRQNKEV